MIRKIGIIYQGPNDRGFLAGLCDRLGCQADLIESRAFRGKNRLSTRRDLAKAVTEFSTHGVGLIVRLTDSDAARWQDIKREELAGFPESVKPILICGVTDGCIENWIAMDRSYLQREIGILESEKLGSPELVGQIKSTLARMAARRVLGIDELVREFVGKAPSDVFKRWLRSESLRAFYAECRDAAERETDCRPIRDELRESD